MPSFLLVSFWYVNFILSISGFVCPNRMHDLKKATSLLNITTDDVTSGTKKLVSSARAITGEI